MKTLAGTGGQVRLILRRDRILLPLWIVPLAVIPISYVQSFGDLFPTAESREKYASNAGFITLYGELSGTSLGEFITWRVGFVPVMIGLFSLLTVIRHTRVEEETGRAELLGSSVVGRHAGLAAALLVTFTANLVLAVLLAVGGAAMVQLPAVWLLAGLTIAIFGLFPRLSPVAWAGPAICMLIGFTGAGVQLDEWVKDISPFSHLPQLPGGSASAAPAITVLAIAVVLGAVGLLGLRRRDLPVG